MNSRERVLKALNHEQPDRVPVDLGATYHSGISVSALYRLRDYYGLLAKTLDVFELMQMIGVVDEDLRKTVGADIVTISEPADTLGNSCFPGEYEKKVFQMPDGTPVYINAVNKYRKDSTGGIYMYPQGDDSVAPSIYMPEGGYFFDSTDRGDLLEDLDEDDLRPREDFKDYLGIIDEKTARYYEEESKRLYTETDYAIFGNLGCASFGDPGSIPAAYEKNPRGIRRFDQWCMMQLLHPEYIKEIFEMQTEYALKNLEIYKQAVGDRIQVVSISGTDFGTQNGPIMSLEVFRELYKPYYKRVCDWVHQNTGWKTFFHSCGSVISFLDDFVEMGVDILNPVQTSAAGMDPQLLKDRYGDKLVFWGGGIDTQHTLSQGTPEEVFREATRNLEIFSKGGGYIFNSIHNIVGDTKVENIAAFFEAVKQFNQC